MVQSQEVMMMMMMMVMMLEHALLSLAYSLHPTTLISSRLTSLRGKRNKARNISWEWDWIMSRMLERFGIARKSLSFVSATPHPLCQDSQRGFYSWRSCHSYSL